ncbi:MAG: methylmalonyl-CoA mutase [Cognaticolwellia sp.]|jgi:methylmalonyl-CoA mutase
MHPLNQSFEIPALQDWQERVNKDLKGRDFERTLVTRTLEGLKIQPLYTQAPSAPVELPGQAPYRRGATALGGTRDLWEMRQPASTAAHAEEALRLGASAVAVSDPADLQAILGAVDSKLAPVHLHGPASQSAEQALDWGLNGGLGISVATDLARDGGLPQSLDDSWKRASWALGAVPAGTLALAVDGSVFHHAGADEASDIALTLAAVAESLRTLETLGHAPEQVLAATELRVALDARMLLSIAKLRALRLCWSQLARACGADVPPRIHAQLSARVQTRRDVWVNILRNSVAVFAGAVGGAQAISSLPFADCATEDDQRLARRIARNTQLVLAQESHLARVMDPAGGAYALETWTQELAQAAWKQFQAIEGAGGLVASLEKGRIQNALQAVSSQRQSRIASRAQAITGVSEFPLAGERRPELRPEPAPLPQPAHAQVQAVHPLRDSAVYEALRDHADRTEDRGILMACIGSPAAYSARLGFASNLVQAGGFEPVPLPITLENANQVIAQGGCSRVVLCGSDADYERVAAPLSQLLGQLGVRTVFLAGKPPPDPENWPDLGGYMYHRCDALSVLRKLWGLA